MKVTVLDVEGVLNCPRKLEFSYGWYICMDSLHIYLVTDPLTHARDQDQFDYLIALLSVNSV